MTAAPDTPRTDPPLTATEAQAAAWAARATARGQHVTRIRAELSEGSVVHVPRCCDSPQMETGRVVNSGDRRHQRVECANCLTILAELSWRAEP